MHPAFSFEGQNTLIVGASHALGRSIALEFARLGARVAVADSESSNVRETVRQITERGGTAIPVECELSDDGSLRRAIHEAEVILGSIDIQVNHREIALGSHPHRLSDLEWQELCSSHYFSVVRTITLVLPAMVSHERGYIVNTASFSGPLLGGMSRIPIAAFKAALIGMSEGLAAYGRSRGIRVSCLCGEPGNAKPFNAIRPSAEDGEIRVPAQSSSQSPQSLARILTEGMCEQKVIIDPNGDSGRWRRGVASQREM